MSTPPLVGLDPEWTRRVVSVGIAVDQIVEGTGHGGLVLRLMREKRDLGQRDVAEQVGCSKSTIHRIESGQQPPGRRLDAICRVLGYDAALVRACFPPRDWRS